MFLILSILVHSLQDFDMIEQSKTLPLSTDIAVTTPKIDVEHLLCQVPSTEIH